MFQTAGKIKDDVVLLLLKFGGHIVRRTWADSSFQPVFNLAVKMCS